MEKLKPCPFCGEYLVRTQNSYTNKHGEKCKEDYYSHDVLKNPEYCLAEEICVGNNLKDITAWNTRPDNWISVEEMLPGTQEMVLTCTEFGEISTEYYYKVFRGFTDKSYPTKDDISGGVTHWMPLPNPPKGVEN